jgi:hypothetical protein
MVYPFSYQERKSSIQEQTLLGGDSVGWHVDTLARHRRVVDRKEHLVAVKDVIDEQNEYMAHGHKFTLWRRQWEEYVDACTLDWQLHRLTDQERPGIPEEPGIYTLLIQPGIANHPACSYLMYVGKTISLHRRFGEYLNQEKRETGRPKIFRLLNMYPDHIWFCFSLVPQADLDTVEETLLVAYIPPANDQLPAEVRGPAGAF